MFRNKGEIDEHNTARLRFKYDALSKKDKMSIVSLVNLTLEYEMLLQDVNNRAPELTENQIDERIKLEEELVQLELVTIKVIRDILNERKPSERATIFPYLISFLPSSYKQRPEAQKVANFDSHRKIRIPRFIKLAIASFIIIISVSSIGMITLAKPVRQAVVSLFHSPDANLTVSEISFNLVGRYVPDMQGYSILDVEDSTIGVLHVTYFDEIEGTKIDYWLHTGAEVIKSDNENAAISQIEMFGKNATILTWSDGTTEIQGIYNDGIDDIGVFRLRGGVAVDTMVEIAASIHLEKGGT